MTQFDLSSSEYLLEITEPSFHLNFVVDDSFYNKEYAAVSIREIVTEGTPEHHWGNHRKVIKVTSRNRSQIVFDKLSQVKTVKVNLALVDLEIITDETNFHTVNSPPMILPIISRKIEFELNELLTDKPMDFTNVKCKRIFVRLVLSPVIRNR